MTLRKTQQRSCGCIRRWAGNYAEQIRHVLLALAKQLAALQEILFLLLLLTSKILVRTKSCELKSISEMGCIASLHYAGGSAVNV
jgi:hypothetical protein